MLVLFQFFQWKKIYLLSEQGKPRTWSPFFGMFFFFLMSLLRCGSIYNGTVRVLERAQRTFLILLAWIRQRQAWHCVGVDGDPFPIPTLCPVLFLSSCLFLNFSSSLSKLPFTLYVPAVCHQPFRGSCSHAVPCRLSWHAGQWRCSPEAWHLHVFSGLLSSISSTPRFSAVTWVALAIVKEVLQSLIHTLFNRYLLSTYYMSDTYLLCIRRQHWTKLSSCPQRAYLPVRKQRRDK